MSPEKENIVKYLKHIFLPLMCLKTVAPKGRGPMVSSPFCCCVPGGYTQGQSQEALMDCASLIPGDT